MKGAGESKQRNEAEWWPVSRVERRPGVASTALGRVSLVGASLAPSFMSLGELPEDGLGAATERKGWTAGEQMPVMLATSGSGNETERVVELLAAHHIPYTVAFVDTYATPRLQVGPAELIGMQEIEAQIDEIELLASSH